MQRDNLRVRSVARLRIERRHVARPLDALRGFDELTESSSLHAVEPPSRKRLQHRAVRLAHFELLHAPEQRRHGEHRFGSVEPVRFRNNLHRFWMQPFERRTQPRKVPLRPPFELRHRMPSGGVVRRIEPAIALGTRRSEQAKPFGVVAWAVAACFERGAQGWVFSPPERKPTRADFGLPDTGTLSRDDQERVRAITWDSLALPPDVVAALNAERRYLGAMKQWESYETWKRERNPARAELERKHGYDTKHATHLVRLMRMGLESLESGILLVRRPDATELVAIRDGQLSYDALLETANELQTRMKRAVEKSALPGDVSFERVDALALEVIREAG